MGTDIQLQKVEDLTAIHLLNIGVFRILLSEKHADQFLESFKKDRLTPKELAMNCCARGRNQLLRQWYTVTSH